jgi:hypothetical protein
LLKLVRAVLPEASAGFDLDLLLKGGMTLLTRPSKRLAKYSGGGQIEEFEDPKY